MQIVGDTGQTDEVQPKNGGITGENGEEYDSEVQFIAEEPPRDPSNSYPSMDGAIRDQSLYFSPLLGSDQSQAKPFDVGSNWFHV